MPKKKKQKKKLPHAFPIPPHPSVYLILPPLRGNRGKEEHSLEGQDAGEREEEKEEKALSFIPSSFDCYVRRETSALFFRGNY